MVELHKITFDLFNAVNEARKNEESDYWNQTFMIVLKIMLKW